MSYVVSKGDLTVSADTEAELLIAIAALRNGGGFNHVYDGPLEAPPKLTGINVHLPGELSSDPKPYAYPPEFSQPDIGYSFDHDKAKFVAVPVEQADYADDPSPMARSLELVEESRSMIESIASQLIPVSRRNLEVLEAVMCFPEGVPNRGLQQLLGLREGQISGRLNTLKVKGLVELIPHSLAWRATQLARRSKLVAC